MSTVSVLITTYYRNELLQRAIESVLSQTYSPVELFVVDGSESENARQVVEIYDDITYLCPTPDPGFHKGRKLGLKQADGDYIQFLDDDDYLKPEKFEWQIPLFDNQIGVVYSGLEFLDGGVRLPENDVRGDVLNKSLAHDTYPACPATLLMDSDILRESESFEHPDGADDEGTQIELAQRSYYDYVDAPLAVVGTEIDNTFSGTWDHIRGLEYLLDYYSELYEDAPDWVENRALKQIHRKKAKKYSETNIWSLKMIYSYFMSSRLAREDKLKHWGRAGASLFGSPGLAVASLMYRYIE